MLGVIIDIFPIAQRTAQPTRMRLDNDIAPLFPISSIVRIEHCRLMSNSSWRSNEGRRYATKRRRRPTPTTNWWRSRNAAFQVIVALEIVFLLCMWTTIPDKIQSLSLGKSKDGIHSRDTGTKRIIQRRRQEETWRKQRHHDDSSQSPAHGYHLQQRFRHNIDDKNYIPTQPTLIIGGSDGSGTRAIAATMQQLGVAMKLDSKETLDTLAPPRSGGWARLVNLVLNHTHSVNYEVHDLPHEIEREVYFLIKRFWGNVKLFRQRGVRTSTTIPTGVYAGVKAPATMVLLPFLVHVIGNVKYLHVVRDGRDIAL